MKGTKFSERVRVMRYLCGRCGHRWIARNPRRPRMCPTCKSVRWDSTPVERAEDNAGL